MTIPSIMNTIEANRRLGGVGWKAYTREELIEIYGYLPEWFEEKDTPSKIPGPEAAR